MEENVQVVHNGFVRLEIVQTPHGPRERVMTTNSVCLLIYVSDVDKIILVLQGRTPMVSTSNPTGEIIELCAGRFDVNLSPQALAVKEAKEEMGIDVTPEEVILLNNGEPVAVSAGILSEQSYLAFATITSDKVEHGERTFGVDAGEWTTRIWLTTDEFIAMQCQDLRVFALQQWFINNRY